MGAENGAQTCYEIRYTEKDFNCDINLIDIGNKNV